MQKPTALTPIALRVAWPQARADARPLAAAAGLGVLGVVLDLARPWPLALAVDALVTGRGVVGLPVGAVLLAGAGALVALTALAGALDMAAMVAGERAAERIGARLRDDVFDHAVTLSPGWHDRMRSGEITARLSTDVGRVLDAVVAVCATLLPDAVRLLVVVAVLIALNPPLALVAFAVIPVLALLAARRRRLVRATQAEARAASGRLAAAAADLLRNVRAIQAFGRGGYAGAQFRDRSGALRDANVRALVTDARFAPLADVTLAIGSGLVLLVGGREVLAGRLAVGGLVVVTSYLSALYSPVRGLSRLSGVLAKAGASAARLDEVLASHDRVVDAPDARPAPRIVESVRFRDVRFGYQPERPVLDGLDLTVRAGETVCLFGPSGVGKSTVLHLLLRLYDVDAGAVLLDGVDIRDVGRASLRRRIAFVPQEPWLLDTTIAANIAFGTERATRHAIQRAGHDALVDEFTDRLPRGYLTEVGEGANRLSGGQRRRIALARAAISDAPLVLLDEPTTGLDPASATAVAQAIRRSTEGRTVIVVTHDQMLAEYADRVVTLTRHDVAGLRVSDSTVRKEVFQ